MSIAIESSVISVTPDVIRDMVSQFNCDYPEALQGIAASTDYALVVRPQMVCKTVCRVHRQFVVVDGDGQQIGSNMEVEEIYVHPKGARGYVQMMERHYGQQLSNGVRLIVEGIS